MTDRDDGGEAILAACRSLGVEVIFCASGSEWAPVWEALARQDHDQIAGPEYVDLLHETLAVAMASGFGIATGRPSLVLLHAVPGLLQGACGIHGALLSQTAMVIASSESSTYGESDPDPGGQWYRNLSVVGGPQTVASAFTKWASQVGSVATLYGAVVRAVEMARRSPAGPVYLNIPVEVLLAPWDRERADVHAIAAPGHRVSPLDELDAAAGLLLAAEHPVILTESVGRHPDGFAALLELAELLAVPVIEPASAVTSNFPRTNPLHRGGADRELLESADLVVLACCRAPWYPPSDRPAKARILVIDDVVHRPYMDYQVVGADWYLEGDVGRTLRALTAEIQRKGPVDARVDARRERLVASRPVPRVPDPTVLDAALVVDRLRAFIHPEGAVIDETITHSRVIAEYLRADAPGRYSYVQGGLGQGLGVALGVKYADPTREVVLTIGDGSFLYNPVVPCLTASDALGLPLLVVVLNNHRYLSMQMNHLRFYPAGTAVRDDNFRGVDLTSQPNIADLAAPFGMFGATVRNPDELDDALERALASVRSGTTALVDVHVVR
jgi:acetolactate synthase-1/2/3 large subunit